jgi:hypothetical protein
VSSVGYVRIRAENTRYALDARDRHIALAAREGVAAEVIAEYAGLSVEEVKDIIEAQQEEA